MPLRINEISSQVRVSGRDAGIPAEIVDRIVQIVLERVREERAREERIAEETAIRNQASEIEPY